MNNVVQFKKKASTAFAGTVATFVGSAALAIDDAAVDAAYDAGTASTDNAVTGLIALIAVVVGVGMVISLLKRG